MRYIITTTLLSMVTVLSAQYGVRMYYGSLGSDSALETDVTLFDSEETVNKGAYWEVGFDYWFQPWEEKRIEFTPAVLYGVSTYGEDLSGFDYSAGSLVLNTRIYPLDFGGGCDCPTFSKEGNLISKGFFFEIAPGMIYNNWKLQTGELDPSGESRSASVSSVTWRAHIGAGLDIGVSDLLTISPSITYQMRGGHAPYEAVEELAGDLEPNPASLGSGLLFGLRVGIRADYNQYGYR